MSRAAEVLCDGLNQLLEHPLILLKGRVAIVERVVLVESARRLVVLLHLFHDLAPFLLDDLFVLLLAQTDRKLLSLPQGVGVVCLLG